MRVLSLKQNMSIESNKYYITFIEYFSIKRVRYDIGEEYISFNDYCEKKKNHDVTPHIS